MSKSADAFRTISEVAQILDVAPHVLRFWEQKFPQIKPIKRGGGRRFYRPEDIALIAGIQTMLRDEGLTIRGARQRIADLGVASVQDTGRTRLNLAVPETPPPAPVQPPGKAPDKAEQRTAPAPKRRAKPPADEPLPLFAQMEAPATPPAQSSTPEPSESDPLARLALALAKCESLTAAPTARDAAPELVGRIGQLARDLRALCPPA